MKIKYKETKPIEEGRHLAEVSKVVHKPATDEVPFDYTDVFFKLDDGQEIKYGCPTNMSTKSKLGVLMSAFFELKDDSEYDPEDMVGKKVSLSTQNDDNGYSRVVDGSVKALEGSKE